MNICSESERIIFLSKNYFFVSFTKLRRIFHSVKSFWNFFFKNFLTTLLYKLPIVRFDFGDCHLFHKGKKNFWFCQIFLKLFLKLVSATLGELPFPRCLKDTVGATSYQDIISLLRGNESNVHRSYKLTMVMSHKCYHYITPQYYFLLKIVEIVF